jgi:hypothetical protein
VVAFAVSPQKTSRRRKRIMPDEPPVVREPDEK